jgi:hypothetical protein
MMCERHGTMGSILGESLQQLFLGTDEKDSFSHEAEAVGNPPGTPTPEKPSRRLKLWELEEKLHCPVVGTCLTIDELKKVARKEGFTGNQIESYRLHIEAVSASCARNSTAVAMHKLLERKHARWVKVFEQAKTDDAVRKLWDEHLARGEVAGPMWAALTHKSAGKETRNQIYGDVHMLSHQIGAGLAADARKLGFLEVEVSRLHNETRQDGYRANQMLGEKTARIKQLEEANQQLNSMLGELSVFKVRAEALESGQAMVGMGRRLLLLEAINSKQQESLKLAQQRVCQLEREAENRARLDKELASVSAERDALERLLLAGLDVQDSEQGQCDGDCGHCNSSLKGCCVLCVGGRTTLLPQYRALAERLGVRLIHHDGGQEEAMSRLPDLLAASDAVICPTDCVSHMAYYQLKRHCKTHGKPCVLTKSGIGGFAAALTRLSEGKAVIQGA